MYIFTILIKYLNTEIEQISLTVSDNIVITGHDLTDSTDYSLIQEGNFIPDVRSYLTRWTGCHSDGNPDTFYTSSFSCNNRVFINSKQYNPISSTYTVKVNYAVVTKKTFGDTVHASATQDYNSQVYAISTYLTPSSQSNVRLRVKNVSPVMNVPVVTIGEIYNN